MQSDVYHNTQQFFFSPNISLIVAREHFHLRYDNGNNHEMVSAISLEMFESDE